MSATQNEDAVTATEVTRGYAIIKQTKSRWWEVRDPAGELVCLTVDNRGAIEVVRRLAA
jgi:hypothetical protein